MNGRLLISTACCFISCFSASLAGWSGDGQGILLYRAQRGEALQAIEEYCQQAESAEEVNFELLHQLTSLFLLERWHRGTEGERLTVLLGASLSRNELFEQLQREAARSENPLLQLIAIRLTTYYTGPAASTILLAVAHSPYIALRLEALQILAQRGDPLAEAQLQGLMERVDSSLHHYFVPLFSLLQRESCCRNLRRFLGYPFVKSRIAAIHAIGEQQHELLTPSLRAIVRQGSPPVVEAAAMALAMVRDLSSRQLLWELSHSSHGCVAVAGAAALALLDDERAAHRLCELAASGNLFAIRLLPQFAKGNESRQLLKAILTSKEPASGKRALSLRDTENAKINGLLSAAELGVIDAVAPAVHWLLNHVGTLSLCASPGESFLCWQRKRAADDEAAAHLSAEGYGDALMNALAHYPEPLWHQVAERLLLSRDKFLAERVVDLLAVRCSAEAIALLRSSSQQSGAPYTRYKSMVTLYRLGEHPELFPLLMDWFLEKARMPLAMDLQEGAIHQRSSPHELLAGEESRLLLEFLEAMALQREQRAILPLMKALSASAKENRPLLAALLLNLLG